MSTRRQLIKGGIAGLFSAGAASVMATPKDQPQQFDDCLLYTSPSPRDCS